MRGRPFALMLPVLLAACGGGGDEPVEAERISLDVARHTPAQPLPSPDTKGAGWSVSANGQAINFGQGGDKPMLTLECAVRASPPRIRIIRHVAARPNEKALFPVIGNGTISRFKVDATLAGGEWRWEGELPASDSLLEVFTGPRELEATLPGGGSLMIEGSRIPGEFVNWCRGGGQAPQPQPSATGPVPQAEKAT